MLYYLKDGSTQFLTDDNREDRMRDMIREQMGDGMAECFDDLIFSIHTELEEKADEYLSEKSDLLCDRIDSILYHFDDYLKAPESLKRNLKDLSLEIKNTVVGLEL